MGFFNHQSYEKSGGVWILRVAKFSMNLGIIMFFRGGVGGAAKINNGCMVDIFGNLTLKMSEQGRVVC